MSNITKTKQVVLLVEDYPAGMFVSTTLIESIGYSVEPATSGQEAIDKIMQTSVPFMAVLMDIQMHKMNGFEATKIIREFEKKSGYRNNIIAVTANAISGFKKICLEAGMDGYISKPIKSNILASTLAEIANKI